MNDFGIVKDALRNTQNFIGQALQLGDPRGIVLAIALGTAAFIGSASGASAQTLGGANTTRDVASAAVSDTKASESALTITADNRAAFNPTFNPGGLNT